jgi:hypothetical protein
MSRIEFITSSGEKLVLSHNVTNNDLTLSGKNANFNLQEADGVQPELLYSGDKPLISSWGGYDDFADSLVKKTGEVDETQDVDVATVFNKVVTADLGVRLAETASIMKLYGTIEEPFNYTAMMESQWTSYVKVVPMLSGQVGPGEEIEMFNTGSAFNRQFMGTDIPGVVNFSDLEGCFNICLRICTSPDGNAGWLPANFQNKLQTAGGYHSLRASYTGISTKLQFLTNDYTGSIVQYPNFQMHNSNIVPLADGTHPMPQILFQTTVTPGSDTSFGRYVMKFPEEMFKSTSDSGEIDNWMRISLTKVGSFY